MGYRKVLLLGNGINRSFSSETWDDIIKNMAVIKFQERFS